MKKSISVLLMAIGIIVTILTTPLKQNLQKLKYRT